MLTSCFCIHDNRTLMAQHGADIVADVADCRTFDGAICASASRVGSMRTPVGHCGNCHLFSILLKMHLSQSWRLQAADLFSG